ncbi:lytic transglycosylase domain-containing protein [Devosia sp. Leaf64]|uniref:lytic transglycosylase domain-containing protein n=1 Tax=Devosia sp. Leaf64 TaxID=1736229 RepID=UPI000AB99A25|nr:lytic transglycosylase domain-containing protein [Devosia sp. Leaf64]
MKFSRHFSAVLLALAMSHVHLPPSLGEEPAGQSCIVVGEQEVCISAAQYREDVCAAIAVFATHWGLPPDYFARLIWQESRFDPAAISPAGAEGIAQFMPATGRLRGLVDPFDPAEAMARSAEYLRFLELKFGNLGLAAAAYNGGEGRITGYIANGGGSLPAETRAYVMIVTGRAVDAWLGGNVGEVDYTLDQDTDFQSACINMAQSVQSPDLTVRPAEWQPWGVLIAQSASADQAQTRFAAAQAEFAAELSDEKLMLITVRNPRFGNRTRFSAMVGRQTRQDAQDLCNRLTAAGGNCIVQKNEV